MKPVYTLSLLLLFIPVLLRSQAADSPVDPGRYDSTWWNRAPVRLIQTNLREIDAGMNTNDYVQSIVDVSANVVLLNVGGIVANYPTKLPFHYKNTYLKGDLVGDLVKQLHAKGIRVIGRYDFSKINETLAAKKPGWLYVGTDGKNVNYNGQVHTCVNGGYQQEYLFDILKEAITSYPLDGIFFNMIGYTTSDYSGINHGICQCANCKKRFHDATEHTLPVTADMNDPVFREYNAFKISTSNELFKKIGSFIKKLNPALIINTYTDAGVDMIRMESSSWLTPEYEWNYFSTDHVKRVLGSYSDRAPSNLLQYFLAIGYRHIATSPNISRTWVLENMLNGAPLDVYVIGTLLNQQDRVFLPVVRDLYGFHKKNQTFFTNLSSVSRVALVRGAAEEYKGLIKLLSEAHIMFDIIEPSVLGSSRTPRALQDYEAIIVGDVRDMDDSLVTVIDQYVRNGGKLMATGFSSTNNALGAPMNQIRLKSLGVNPEFKYFRQAKSTYLAVDEGDKTVLGKENFKDLDLVMMYSDFLQCKTNSSAKGYLRLIPETMFGPPEKSYYTNKQVTNFPGVVSNAYGKGSAVFIPWLLGSQYHFKGHHAHRALFGSVLNNLLQVNNPMITDASPLIEMTRLANRNGAFEWIGMINHAGQLGASIRESVPIYNTNIRFKPLKKVKELRLLRAGTILNFKETDGWIDCTVPKVDDFEMLLCLYN